MKAITIFGGDLNRERKSVSNFDSENIKEVLGDRKDFVSIGLKNFGEVVHYKNGIILSFDEVLDIIKMNPKYKEVRSEINLLRLSFNEHGESRIAGYRDYLEKAIFYPHTKEFRVLYYKPKLITDLIPEFNIDFEPLNQVKEECKNFNHFYLEDDKTENINEELNKSNMEEFLGFVGSLFEIENEELFKKDENKIIEKNKIFSEEMFISPESFSDPNETYYETFGIDIDFNLEDLNKALENKVKSIQRMYDGDDAEIRKQIDIVLDKYNTLITPSKKSEYDKSLGIEEPKQPNLKSK